MHHKIYLVIVFIAAVIAVGIIMYFLSENTDATLPFIKTQER